MYCINYFLGHGEDCFRTWESVMFGAIPIVKNSTLWPLFKGFVDKTALDIKDINVPINHFVEAPVFVLPDDWTDSLTEETLLNFEPQVKHRDILLVQDWFDKINSYRSAV